MFNIQVRKAIADDDEGIWAVRTAAIESISNQYYAETEIARWASTPPPPNFRHVIAHLNWHVAELNDYIIGTGFIDLETGEMGGIFVAPSFQGCGIGFMLVNALEEFAKNHDVKNLFLDATLNAESFYLKAGFCFEKKSIYKHNSGIHLNCIRMTKKID